ncbi:dTMP kinase [Commensalibacter sp. Nvir]|uniref:dTMP kinase n=1 Tax=Commensalibacter sp. Nvir TaxID=3069817 RepID=UPI0030C8B68B
MIKPLSKGYFITFEGGEGGGKSTQAKLLTDALTKHNFVVTQTREPGGSPGAEEIRDLLLFGKHTLSLKAEILAHFSARMDHVDQLIYPALNRGEIVICDRFIDSTLAYQGYGLARGDKKILKFIHALSNLIDVKPQLTFLLKTSLPMMQNRCQQRNQRLDRYERLPKDFHHDVLEGFQIISKHNAYRYICIDASESIEAIHQKILSITFQKLATLPHET